ncbi:transporter [Sandarakinorhabdus sp. AAP62]|uniref:transporter n=1 Tax=Sandarakinorhabdus sp. AAP62 TaxID=1248916 RepID=UPI001FB0B6F7|nr:transporter [Sandarakinorhabdus sp. AAP62]
MAGQANRPAAMMRLAALAGMLALPAAAQTVPTASSADAPICTDRPTKSNFACTVPSGLVQIEADAFSWISTRAGGARVDQLLFSNPTIKFGLSSRSDIQLNWVPYTRVRRRDAAGTPTTQAGTGDVTLRYKHRLTAADGTFQLALLPFVKLPTAPAGIGNRRVEAGIAAPMNISVPGGWTITLGPQLDVLADSDGRGHHGGITGLFNVAKQFGAFTLYNELWTSQNFDPAGTVRQYSYDVSLAWLARPTLQLDIGANIGLNRDTPDLVAYLGVSSRF